MDQDAAFLTILAPYRLAVQSKVQGKQDSSSVKFLKNGLRDETIVPPMQLYPKAEKKRKMRK